MAQSKRKLDFPDRKISETFLHFAEPLLDAFGPDATEDEIEQSLKIAFTVWNCVVYDVVSGNPRYLDMIRASTADDPDSAALIRQLIDRKQRFFADDNRLIGEYKLTRRKDEWRLRAEARDPRSRK